MFTLSLFLCSLVVLSSGILLDNIPNKPGTSASAVKEFPHDCQDVLWAGHSQSGVYTIYPQGSGQFEVFCDQDTDGGGWTVFQRRSDGSENFYRTWIDYKYGFGNTSNEFWLGNHRIFEIIKQGYYELRVDLMDFNEETRQATYRRFSIGSEDAGYVLMARDYNGTAGDSMGSASKHSGSQFYTKDRDNPEKCAQRFKGGWWYANCHVSNLNGLYLRGIHSSFADGIEWYSWHQYNYSLKKTEMKIRRL